MNSDSPRTLAKIGLVYALIFVLPAAYLILFPFEGGDYYHNIWVLSNNIRNLTTLHSFADANINYPVSGIGLLHELEPISTILFIPFYATGTYITGYYVLLYLSVVLTALVVAWLALLVGARTVAALLIGFATGVLGYRYLHLSHVQAVSIQWMLLPVVFWVRYEKNRRNLDYCLFHISHAASHGAFLSRNCRWTSHLQSFSAAGSLFWVGTPSSSWR